MSVAPASEAASGILRIKVRIAPALSLSLSSTIYNFGDIGVSTTVLASPFTITNDSLGRSQDYRVDASTVSQGLGGAPGWRNDFIPSPDKFQLCWQFKAAGSPVPVLDSSGYCDTNGWTVFDTIEASLQPGSANAGQADDVPSGAGRNLWLLFRPPTSTSLDTTQRIFVTITAADAGSF